MIIVYVFREPAYWIVPLLIQIISYVKILGKMGKRPAMGIIPVLGEMEMSKDLFRNMRVFWRPAIIAAVTFGTSMWIGTDNEYGIMLKLAALIVYGCFLVQLYWRLGKQFGKNWVFRIGLIIMPLLFLPVLGFGRSAYLGPREFPPEKERSKASKALRKAGIFLISAVELVVLIGGCFGLAMMLHPVRPLAKYMMDGDLKKMSTVTATDEVVGRKDTLGADYEKTVKELRSRDYFFPDHSKDRKVVVMEYIIGSNLEDDRGSASVNIAQMKDATSKGNGLEFVIQTGGSKRWFTSGIEDSSVGRYVVSGGELKSVEELDDDMCMSEPENLADFIAWAKKNYPADRYMLILWDHGGGFSTGFGIDDLNRRMGESSAMTASEIIDVIKNAGMKFDLIGFDACLMQNIEYANAFEPYADYYLASEETEPAYGWFYTAGFGKLAEDPALSTEEFGRMMVSSYDQLYRTMNDGKPKPDNTLSLVDLTLVKPAYDQLRNLYSGSVDQIKVSPAVFADMSAARSKSYQFYDGQQIDLLNFLNGLKKADYKEEIASDADMDRLMDAVRACVVCRNKDAAEGINGLSTEFPYNDIGSYTDEYEQLKAVNYSEEEEFFNNFCSILGSQQERQQKETGGFFGILFSGQYKNEDWYVEGFEDYDTTNLFVDIPVSRVEGGYLPDLPDKTWDTILDVSTSVYMVTDDGLMYLGRESVDAGEYEGHPLIAMDGMWVRINGQLVCYQPEESIETDDGIVYRGTVRGRLNGTENIIIHVEWDPVKEDSDTDPEGHVTGYNREEEKQLFFMRKGLEQFSTGDSVEFIFDWYDEEGKLRKTDTYGKPIRVVTDKQITVKDEPLGDGTELEYYGILTDVYQRELMTEAIREKVSADKDQ